MGAFDDLMSQRPGEKRIPTQEQFDLAAQQASLFDNVMAGMGGGLRSYYLGLKQRAGLASQQDLEEYFKTMDALDKVKGGTSGAFVGQAIPAMAAGMIPGAGTVLGSMGVGTGLGFMQPTRPGESTTQNAITSGLASAAFPAASALYRGGKALVDPFRQAGQERIAGDVLSRFATDRTAAMAAASNPRQLVPGSLPTLGEATLDPGLATLQSTLHSMDPTNVKGALTARMADQNSARIAALRGIAGTPDDMAAAIAARERTARDLYKQAFDLGVDPAAVTPQIEARVKSLLDRPTMRQVVDRAKVLAQDAGENIGDPAGSLRGMHYIKKALDDMLDSAKATGVGKITQRNVADMRSQLIDVMDELSPAYKQARNTFESMSRPINQMEITGRLYDKTTRALTEDTSGQKLYGDKFANVLRNEETLVKGATGFKQGMADVLDTAQMSKIQAIKDDLARSAQAQGMAQAQGSPTSQYLVGQDIVRNMIGPMGIPQSLAKSGVVENFINRPASFLYKDPEQKVMGLLSGSLTDPTRAAKLMSQSGSKSAFQRMLENEYLNAGLLGSGFAFGTQP